MTDQTLADVLRGEGLTDRPDLYDSSIHSWRCEHPDKYGACDCFADLVEAVLDLLTSDRMREAVAREFYVAKTGATREWSLMAWADMGGSEPSAERADIEIAATAALAAIRTELEGQADE